MKNPPGSIDILQWTVNETLARAPQSVEILNRLGVDTCCGGSQTLAEAAHSIGLKPEDLAAALAPAFEVIR